MTRKQIICPNCATERKAKQEKREETYTVRGQEITIPVVVDVCTSCGESVFNPEQDQALMERAYAEYRRRRGLLRPKEIKSIRERYGLNQKSFATLLGMGRATIARYENGSLQDDAHDQLIRMCAKPQNMKVLLDDRGHLLSSHEKRCVRQEIENATLIERLDISSLMPDGADEYTGFRLFDYFRYVKAVLWFCCIKPVPATKMNKLLFYSDFLHFKQRAVSITGVAYRKRDYGPVPEHYGILREMMEADGYISLQEVQYYDFVAVEYCPGPRSDEIELDDMDEFEEYILQHVATYFKGHSAKQVSDKSHQERAWLETHSRALISYRFAEYLDLPI
jgi:putative zinc finger/helix-turn-helix YgiT family protein